MIRPPTDDEREVVRGALDAWADGLLERLESARAGRLLVADGRTGSLAVWLASAGLAADVTESPWPVEHAGLPLGEVVDGTWRLSLPAAQLVAPEAAERCIRVDAKGGQRFLYGRGVPDDRIKSVGSAVGNGDIAVVADAAGNALGLGRFIREEGSGDRQVQPVVDLGWYLREGG